MNCYICNGTLKSLGTVPFDRNNAGVPIVNDTPIEYVKCESCDCILCPEMLAWTPRMLGDFVYNEQYVNYDPDYISSRPTNYANTLLATIHPLKARRFKHLDYGSGSGVMSNLLNSKGWNSRSYDPYSSPTQPDGLFNFITAIEVVEHSLNINDTISDMKKYLDRNGVILFSTLLSDDINDIGWWYIGARNGHINIMSKQSMIITAKKHNLFFNSISANLHILQSARSNCKDLLGLTLPK